MPSIDPTRRGFAIVVAMFAGIAAARLAIPNDIAGITFLYVIPISVLAIEFGVRGGLTAAAVAIVLNGIWRLVQEADHGLVEFPVRAFTFVLVGVLVGMQSERRRLLERERDALISELREIAAHDTLTGLPNRRGWDAQLRQELERARRSSDPVAVLAIDLDGLKEVNDTQGHAAGDEFLIRCAAAWRRAVRSAEFVARLGGDEFAALLPNASEAAATTVAERAQKCGPDGRSFSVGIAIWDPRESGLEVMRRADEALYEAKRAGGGRIAVAAAMP